MTEDEIPDEVIVKLTDYFDNTLPPNERADVEKKVAADPVWKQVHDEMAEDKKLHDKISGLQKARAPGSFTEDVTGTIAKRSAGRFFARRTLGDRVPFGVLLIVALIGLGVIGYLMWSSQTGSIAGERPRAEHGSDQIVPVP